MRKADSRAEILVPYRMDKMGVLTHDAARVGIVLLEICTNIMLHAQDVTHFMRRNVKLVRRG